MIIRFKKWICKNFGCKIIDYISPGFLHLECTRCGDIFEITHKEDNWKDKAFKCIAMRNSIFKDLITRTVNDYREAVK